MYDKKNSGWRKCYLTPGANRYSGGGDEKEATDTVMCDALAATDDGEGFSGAHYIANDCETWTLNHHRADSGCPPYHPGSGCEADDQCDGVTVSGASC